jgi:hypothetical protein
MSNSSSSEPSEKPDDLGLSTGNVVILEKKCASDPDAQCKGSDDVAHLNAIVSGEVEETLSSGDNGGDKHVSLKIDPPTDEMIEEAERAKAEEGVGTHSIAEPAKSSPTAGEDEAPVSSKRGPDQSSGKKSDSKPPEERPTKEDWDEEFNKLDTMIRERARESMVDVHIPDDIRKVADLAKFHKVKAVELKNHMPYIRDTRNEVLGSTIRDAILYVRENLRNAGDISPHDWYERIARVYRGYGIPIRNVLQVLGEESVRLFMRPDGRNPANVVELAGGNADIARQIARGQAQDGYMRQYVRLGQIGRIPKTRFTDLVDFFYDSPLFDYISRPGGLESMLSSVWAVDYVGKYAKYVSKKGIIGVTSDICVTPAEFFRMADDRRRAYAEKRKATDPSFDKKSFLDEKKTLKPNSADVVIMNLALDRIRDFNAAIEIMKRLAKGEEVEVDGERKFVAPERPTKFFIGSIFPLSTHSDSDTDEVPDIPFWDAVGSDPRIRMREEYCQRDPDRPSYISTRAWSIYRCITALADKGLVVDRIAEQPSYEVFSPHCMLDTAYTLRTRYHDRLNAKHFHDEDLERLRKNILEGRVRNDALILLPQEYRIVLLGGRILRPEKV